jgi:hypothetical protein
VPRDEEAGDDFGFADGTQAPAKQAGSEPPPLELVEDSGDLELDVEPAADAEVAGIHEDELQILGEDEVVEAEFEPNDAGEELKLDDPDKPAAPRASAQPDQEAAKPSDRYEDQWGFLTRDDRK